MRFPAHTARAALAITLLVSAFASLARAQAFETPPTLDASDAAPAKLLSGPGFRVETRVPTTGITTRFTIRSEAGTFEALGVETLALRVSEIPAIVQLDQSSKAATFLDAAGSTAIRPIESAAQILTSPGETLAGLPGGLERFFDRVSTGAQAIANAATSSDTDVAARGEQVVQMSGGAAANALGYNLELRQLAKRLHVDPYTSNPVLARKLGEFTKVAFAAHVATNTLVSVAVPASIAITATNVTRDLVYDTPSGDLIARNTSALQAMGVSDDGIQALQTSPGFTLSLQTELVDALQQLPNASGEPEVVALAATARSADQALFLVRALRMLGRYQQEVAPITGLTAQRTIAATDQNGALVLPAPVDYVSWTERVAGFAERSDLAAPQRSVWIAGRMTPRAKAGFEALGWTVRENVSAVRRSDR